MGRFTAAQSYAPGPSDSWADSLYLRLRLRLKFIDMSETQTRTQINKDRQTKPGSRAKNKNFHQGNAQASCMEPLGAHNPKGPSASASRLQLPAKVPARVDKLNPPGAAATSNLIANYVPVIFVPRRTSIFPCFLRKSLVF